jgi:hypothetical protein
LGAPNHFVRSGCQREHTRYDTCGVTPNAKSGPNGVLVIDNEIWAGDGDSTVKVIDINAMKIVAQKYRSLVAIRIPLRRAT